MNIERFLSADKALLIAPAGFGKTHFISDAVKTLSSKQLILTHTHAGVASIKQRLSSNKVPNHLYHVETISGFAQRFTYAYYTGGDVPGLELKEHFPFVTKKAADLFSIDLIAKVITQTYCGLFVDEYQDCTQTQHRFVRQLAKLIPTRLLGDYLQGIFDLGNEPIVDLQCSEQMTGFIDTVDTLDQVPWRWRNSGNTELGEAIMSIRESLLAGEPIDLSQYKAIELVHCAEHEIHDFRSLYGQRIKQLSVERNVLFIHPRSESAAIRLKVIKSYQNRFYMIEAIDESAFYESARKIDEANSGNFIGIVGDVFNQIANRTELKNWIDKGRIRNKDLSKLEHWKINRYKTLLAAADLYGRTPTLRELRSFLEGVYALPGIHCYRREIFTSLIRSMTDAHQLGITVEDAMIKNRNRLRSLGRQITGRCIGTTLLTKGLEFGTVGILNAQIFTCPKHFYVAISRASKRLVIFSNTPVINPYGN